MKGLWKSVRGRETKINNCADTSVYTRPDQSIKSMIIDNNRCQLIYRYWTSMTNRWGKILWLFQHDRFSSIIINRFIFRSFLITSTQQLSSYDQPHGLATVAILDILSLKWENLLLHDQTRVHRWQAKTISKTSRWGHPARISRVRITQQRWRAQKWTRGANISDIYLLLLNILAKSLVLNLVSKLWNICW